MNFHQKTWRMVGIGILFKAETEELSTQNSVSSENALQKKM